MGVGKGKERQLQVASTSLRTRYMVPCTMQAVHGDAGLMWARMWVMWVLRWDHHPFAIPALHCTAAIRTLLLALIQCLPPQLRRGQHEASDGSTLSWPLASCAGRGQQKSSLSHLARSIQPLPAVCLQEIVWQLGRPQASLSLPPPPGDQEE